MSGGWVRGGVESCHGSERFGGEGGKVLACDVLTGVESGLLEVTGWEPGRLTQGRVYVYRSCF